MLKPQVGDIWQWTRSKYRQDFKGYIDVFEVILVLSEPLPDVRDPESWKFTALVLDGEAAGVIEPWWMFQNDTDCWRQLA